MTFLKWARTRLEEARERVVTSSYQQGLMARQGSSEAEEYAVMRDAVLAYYNRLLAECDELMKEREHDKSTGN